MNAIDTSGLKKWFGAHRAVDGIDLTVPGGAVYGFLGKNGAGKTTTIRLLLGLLRPTEGRVRIFGHDVAADRRRAARLVGSLVETPSHYDHLTGRENLEITRRLLGARRADIDLALDIVDLAADSRRRVSGYSLGMRQRLGVARALIGSPRLLVLDEPTNGLDPNGIREMRQLIRDLSQRDGMTIVVSSHALSEVEQFATHLGLIHRGRMMIQGPAADVLAQHRGAVRFEVDRPDAAIAILRAAGIAGQVDGPSVIVPVTDPAAAPSIAAQHNALLVARGLAVSGVSVSRPSLEDIFVAAVGDDDSRADFATAA